MRFRYSTNKKGKLIKKAIVYTSEEHGINNSDVDPQAVFIVERLFSNGFETYIVGGAVRDLILGKKPKDFDIVSAANPTRIKKIFRNARIIGNRFRLVHVNFGPKTFEVSTFRSLKDGHTSNTFGDVEEDVLRRDFTMNALLYDPLKQIVVDYIGGMKDIKAKKIRPIIPLSNIFSDDPVRMIRAVKYGAVTGFTLPLSLRLRIRKQSSLLSKVSPSRLTEEFFKIIHSPMAGRIVEDLDSAGIYQYLQPQAVLLFKTMQNFRINYFKSLNTLKDPEFMNRPGEALAAFIRDYLDKNVDWTGKNISPDLSPREHTPKEIYKDAFMVARKFVMPMNPPRIVLDHAVRLIFAEHGIIVKKGRFNEKIRKSHDKKPPENLIESDPSARRRRRRKTSKRPIDQNHS